MIALHNFNLLRNDRLGSIGGGVCTYINSNIYCRRLTEFESPTIESLWLLVRPKKIPRSVSVIFLAVVYHSTISRQSENAELYSHIQCNVDSFLQPFLSAAYSFFPWSGLVCRNSVRVVRKLFMKAGKTQICISIGITKFN